MIKLSIITFPNENLRKRSIEIKSEEIKKMQSLIFDMIETMRAAGGIGLAAPQVGKNIRACVIGKDATKDLLVSWQAFDKNKDLVLVNPMWRRKGIRKTIDTEGCLSVPKKYGKVKRWKKIKVKALDELGNPLSFSASDLLARVIQHEVDHLDGVLFIDKAREVYKIE